MVSIYRSITELLLMSQTGLNDVIYNAPTWYLSAMFISMLPLAYLLYKKSDFTLYVFAPLASVMVLGYICQIGEYGFISQLELSKFVMGGILRAISGLCFGITAWTICQKIKIAKINKNARILLTIAEAVLYLIFFVGWFNIYDRKALMAIVIILPIALAITFSNQSYICQLFRFKWMKYFAPLSFTIYLNHIAGRFLTEYFFAGRSFKFCVAMMSLFTAIACLLNFAMVKFGKMLWNRKLKKLFTDVDNL